MRQLIIYTVLIFITVACSNDNIDELNILPPDLDWDKTIYSDGFSGGSIENDITPNKYAIESTSDNGFVIAVNGGIEKYNALGDTLWEKTFSGEVQAIKRLSNNEYLLAGMKNNDIWAAKTDENWNVIWQQSIYTDNAPVLSAIAEAHDGIIFGGTNKTGTAMDAWLLKLDDNGTRVWEHKFERSGEEYLHDIEIARTGNILTVGRSNSIDIPGERGGYDVWVTNFDKDGNLIWENRYGKEDVDEGYGIQENNKGDFMILAYYGNAISAGTSISIIDKNGKLKSEYDHGKSSFRMFKQLQNGDFLLLGFFQDTFFWNYNNSNALAKLNQNSERIWQRNFQFEEYSTMTTIAACQITDGSYILLSNYMNLYSNNQGYVLNKTKPE